MNTKGVCPIGCEHAIGGAWRAFGLEEGQRHQAEAAAAYAPAATQGNRGEPLLSNISMARRRWVTKLKAVTSCRGRHWPSTPEEAGQLRSQLRWGPSDMWSAVDPAEAYPESTRRPAHREGEQRSSQVSDSNARQRNASQPTPLPPQRQAADPPAADDEEPRSDSQPILSIRLPFICLRPPHQGIRWDLLHSERARRFAVKRSLMLFKEFQATLSEEVQRNANAYLTKPPTEKSAVESQRDTEVFHHQLAKSLYKEFETDMKRKLADIQNGVPDDDDIVDNRGDTEINNSPDAEEDRQSRRVDENDRIRMTPRNGERSIPENRHMNTHQTEGRQKQRSAHPPTMLATEPAHRREGNHEVSGYYPPHSADIRQEGSRSHGPILQRTAELDGWNSRAPHPGQAAAPHRQENSVDPPVNPTRRQRGAHHHRSCSDNAYEVRPPPTPFLDPTNPPARDHRQSRLRSASVSTDARPQWGLDTEAIGSHYQYPSTPKPGRTPSEFNSARPPPPKARPDSAPIGRRVPSHTNASGPSHGAGFHYPTPPRYLPATMEESIPAELSDELGTIGPDVANLHWLDQYFSDQYIAAQYMDVANAFKESESDRELSQELSDLEAGRLQSSSADTIAARAPAPATPPMLRSGVAPKSSRMSNMAVPPLIASEESNTDSDSDATVSDLTIQSESESDETPTQSTYSSPLASAHIPKILSSFVGQNPPANPNPISQAKYTVQRTASRQAPSRIVRPERREVHFAEEPAVRYFKR